MAKRPSAVSQADLNRVVKAAHKIGARVVEVDLTATAAKLRIMLDEEGAAGVERPKPIRRPRSLLG